jgi:hypothetical protein
VSESFWKKLFAPGPFDWAFKIRQGDAGEFFANQDEEALRAKGKSLDENPECYVAVMSGSQALVDEVWKFPIER